MLHPSIIVSKIEATYTITQKRNKRVLIKSACYMQSTKKWIIRRQPANAILEKLILCCEN